MEWMGTGDRTPINFRDVSAAGSEFDIEFWWRDSFYLLRGTREELRHMAETILAKTGGTAGRVPWTESKP